MAKKKQILLFSIIGIIILSSVLVYYYYYGAGDGVGDGGENIDLSFSKWTYTGIITGKTYIKDMQDYIEIENKIWGRICSAQLNFDATTIATLKLKVKFLAKSGFVLDMRSGPSKVFTLSGDRYNRRMIFRIMSLPSIILVSPTISTTWYDIEISFKINGATSKVTVKLDGTKVIDAKTFTCNYVGMDNIYYRCAKYYIYGDTTHLKLGSLVVYN